MFAASAFPAGGIITKARVEDGHGGLRSRANISLLFWKDAEASRPGGILGISDVSFLDPASRGSSAIDQYVVNFLHLVGILLSAQ